MIPKELWPTVLAEEIRVQAGLPPDEVTTRLLEAFCSVPRERHAPPPPWYVKPALQLDTYVEVPAAHPERLYHCVLIALERERGINIGEPSFWARMLHAAMPAPGARILQIGGGSGYYTAILAHLVGSKGRVISYEREAPLVALAEAALTNSGTVEVRLGDGANPAATGVDLLVAFAGVAEIPSAWHAALAPGGAVLAPFIRSNGWGAMVHAWKGSDGSVSGRTLGSCGFYPCFGARSKAGILRTDEALAVSGRLNGWSFTFQKHHDGHFLLPS